MSVALATLCFAVVAFFTWVLTGLVTEMIGVTLCRLREYSDALQQVHKGRTVLVMPSRERPPVKRITGRVAMVSLILAGVSLRATRLQAVAPHGTSSVSESYVGSAAAAATRR